ncbi:Soluble aldose sugar dehydrogenase YliI precursor [Symmachiella dynata]|uniref:PQQ-dependent sugar dehydrogenase n=1 Tax=Symmachiella dynata TaxID=2527995 RepID=UPI00118AAB36|nr:PQQ-dependent sugar dehydrogenase [Symmachiella dynata]QDT48451.1 Soluble aldose sugar dehydrogenase YliI precursor [Symmachiella dynata]
MRLFAHVTCLMMSLVAGGGWIALSYADDAAEKTPPAESKPSEPEKPFGLTKRVPWTTSRVKGSPEPPPPYKLQREYPHLKFDQPIAMVPEPDSNRIFIFEVGGKLLTFEDDPDVSDSVAIFDMKWIDKSIGGSGWGLTLHPNYAENGYAYIFLNVTKRDGQESEHNYIYRIQLTKTNPPQFVRGSETLIVKWATAGHGGGDLAFGPDGYLYIGSGDGTSGSDVNNTGQDLSDFTGSILRIDVDHPSEGKEYSIPPDNPFLDVEGAIPEAWTNGHRQVWRMSFDRETGNLWVGEVGQDLWEMIHLIRRGGNYGWSIYEGSHPFMLEREMGPGKLYKPIVEHPHSESRSITGGYVYRAKKRPEFYGMYIYCDYETGIVWGFRYEDEQVKDHQRLSDSTYKVATFGHDHDRELYLVALSGEIFSLVPSGAPAHAAEEFPRKLSETGLFTSVPEQIPAAGVLPYSVNAPAWVDGAHVQRFVGVPGEEQITYGGHRGWEFPNNTVAAQTLSLEMEAGNPASRRPIETRLLTRQEGEWMAYTYMWNDAGDDADLVGRDGMDRKFQIRDAAEPKGVRQQTWRYAARTECMGCHSRAAKWVLGLNTLQMNRDYDFGAVTDNQIRAWDHIGMFKESPKKSIGELPKLSNPYDESAELNARARSYLHANCSHCHVSDGGGNAKMELEFTSDEKKANIFNIPPNHGNFSINNGQLIAKGAPERSVILYRLSKLGQGRMPVLGSAVVDEEALKLFREWVAELPTEEDATTTAQAAQPEDLNSDVVAKRTAAIKKLLDNVSGAMVAVSLVDQEPPASSLRGEIIAAGAAHTNPLVRDLFERFVPEEQRVRRLGPLVRPEQILALTGDAERGRELFFKAAGVQCRDCHKIGDEGRELGPELTHVAKDKDKMKILDTILNPSKEIHKDYVSYIIETKRGQVHAGLLVEKTEDEVVLKDNQHELIRISRADIEILQPQDKSLMPEMLLREMTAEQAADLLQFLVELK